MQFFTLHSPKPDLTSTAELGLCLFNFRLCGYSQIPLRGPGGKGLRLNCTCPIAPAAPDPSGCQTGHPLPTFFISTPPTKSLYLDLRDTYYLHKNLCRFLLIYTASSQPHACLHVCTSMNSQAACGHDGDLIHHVCIRTHIHIYIYIHTCMRVYMYILMHRMLMCKLH